MLRAWLQTSGSLNISGNSNQPHDHPQALHVPFSSMGTHTKPCFHFGIQSEMFVPFSKHQFSKWGKL
jgi:hypothetical protein